MRGRNEGSLNVIAFFFSMLIPISLCANVWRYMEGFFVVFGGTGV